MSNTGTGFLGRTRVRIEHGQQDFIGRLAEPDATEAHVVTCDQYGQIAMRHAVQPQVTGLADTLMHITLGADLIQCTPDVEFMLADRTYRAAGDLKTGDRLKVYPSGTVTLASDPVLVTLPSALGVFDMSVPSPSNFALACGPFVRALGTTWAPYRSQT